jgi:hypothetical protein
MTGEPDLADAVLRLAFRHRITGPDADSGIAELAGLAGQAVSQNDWRAAVAQLLTAGYIHDPVRLPEGALQCHWHLELTPKGVAAARKLLSGP